MPMPTYKYYTDQLTGELDSLYGAREARSIALRLLEDVCGLSQYAYITEPGKEIEDRFLQRLAEASEDLKKGRPLQYVTGVQEFFGREFAVREGVLIPRPETEELVLMVKKYAEGSRLRILDAACGSGCIGISLACELPQSEVFLCDISPVALEVTGENINSLCMKSSGQESLSTVPAAFYADLLEKPLSQAVIEAGTLDILVSNPPYIRQTERILMHKNVLDFEPEEALFVPDENPLIFYKALAEWGLYLLRPEGRMFMEINEALGDETKKILLQYGYSEISVNRDINEKDRMVACLRP